MKKPNIILINIDDMGYGDLGCYGSTINKTPTLDRLAKNGVKFTDFYAAASVCTPSRAGLLTGCYPKRINMQQFDIYNSNVSKDEPTGLKRNVLFPCQPDGLNPNEKTLATLLKAAGYSTKIVGKWHLGDQEEFSPLNYGFDSYLGLPYSNDLGITKPRPKLFDDLGLNSIPLPLMIDKEIIEEQPDVAYLTELYTNTANEYIRENKDRPFFLYFAHTYVHKPLNVNERFMKNSENGLLGGALSMIDWSLASIEYELDKHNILDDTLIIVVSDNGGARHTSNAPLKGYKGSYYEGGHRVNCIMQWKNAIPIDSVCNEICSMIDFYPTFAEIAQIDDNDGIKRDGVSILNSMKEPNKTQCETKVFYFYTSNNLTAVRYGDYKLILATGELFNLKLDISESNDISDRNSAIITKIHELAQLAREDMGDDATNTVGMNCRERGFVKDFKPLAVFDKDKPYIVPFYDL